MKIIILGAGQVGTTLAANLVSEDNDITLVDNESQHLQNLQYKHNIQRNIINLSSGRKFHQMLIDLKGTT